MSNVNRPVSFASVLGRNIAGSMLPSGFASWTVPIYGRDDTDQYWYYLDSPIADSVVVGYSDPETPIDEDVTMIFPAHNSGTRDRSFKIVRTDRTTGESETARVPVDAILSGGAELVAGSLSAEFSATNDDADPLRSGVRVWTIPVTSFLGDSRNSEYFVFLSGPGDSLRSDGGNDKTRVTEDVSFIFPAVGGKRKRKLTVRLLNSRTGKSSTVEIPLDA